MMALLPEGFEGAEPVLREAEAMAAVLTDPDDKDFYGVQVSRPGETAGSEPLGPIERVRTTGGMLVWPMLLCRP